MARIQIADLPNLEDLSPEEAKNIRGGATAIEYGLIASGISVAIISTVQSLGTNLNSKFSSISSSLGGPTATTGGGAKAAGS